MHAKVWPNVIIGSFSLKSANFRQNYPIFAQNELSMKNKFFAVCMSLVLSMALCGCGEKVYHARDFGIVPGTGEDMTHEVALAIETIKAQCNGEPAVLLFEEGEYDFYPDSALVREYYVSNHDQDNPKRVAVALE